MKWTCKHEKFSTLDTWAGRKNNIKFEISETSEGDYYILANCVKEDITWNSLWNKIRFDNLDEAKEYCENLKIEDIKELLKNKLI